MSAWFFALWENWGWEQYVHFLKISVLAHTTAADRKNKKREKITEEVIRAILAQ